MFCMLKKKNIYPYYISKHNTNREEKVILLMISNGDKPRERLETLAMQAESHEKVRGNKDSCNIIMSSEYAKILEFNQYQTSYTEPFIIYADLECIIGKTDGCKNNPENSSTTKVGKHIQSGFSTSTIS